ncbi:MAG: hypothetical protein AAF414_10175 [Pseudomonadota bacterium]
MATGTSRPTTFLRCQEQWHYLIGGASRSGKSTLASLLKREVGGTVVWGDALVTAFSSAVRDAKIPNEAAEPFKASFFSSLICHYARSLSRAEDGPIIVEGIGLKPESIDRTLLRQARFRCVFLGYPYVSVAQKITQIRRHAADDPLCWSHKTSDLRLREIVQAGIEDSLETRLKCFKLGLPFFDTGKDFDAAIKAACDRLLKQANDNRLGQIT